MIGQKLTHSGENANDLDVYLNRSFAIQNAGEHGNPLFCKTKWCVAQAHFFRIGGAKLAPPIFKFFFGHFKHKVFGKTFQISLYLSF